MRKQLLLSLFLVLGLSTTLYAQKDTVNVPGFIESDGQEGTLNDAIEQAKTDGTINNTVFKLTPYDYYILTETVVVDSGQTLELVAPEPIIDVSSATEEEVQNSAPPQIMWTTSGAPNTDYMIQSFGDITLKNIWIRYADAQGNQVSTSIQMEDQPDSQEKAVFEGVIFDYAQVGTNGGGSVNVNADHFVGIFKKCYFRNNTDPHYRYYGRAVSFPFESTGLHSDSVYFENTTFANIGYVLMQEGGNWSSNVHFNHCTFLNISMFSLESGWWQEMSVTNSIFVNPFMYGYQPAQLGEGDEPNGGIFSIAEVDSFGFVPDADGDGEADFTDPERQILLANTSYKYKDWLLDWMENAPISQTRRQNREDDLIPQPHPYINEDTKAFMDSTDEEGNRVHPLMNRANNYIGTAPGFNEPATARDSLKTWLNKKWDDNTDIDWAYKTEAGYDQTWPLPEDLSYTNDTLLTGAMGEYPLGDLYHWYPQQYEDWKGQKDAEWDRITTWMETGEDPEATSVEEHASVPQGYKLKQNYPNPFNPTTRIEYSVPNSSHITLKVYNALGQEVKTLFQGERAAGNYTAKFDGTGLSSGIYFYRLEAENAPVSITKKLTLIK